MRCARPRCTGIVLSLVVGTIACRPATPSSPVAEPGDEECEAKLAQLAAQHADQLEQLGQELAELKQVQEQLEQDRAALDAKIEALPTASERDALLVEKGRLECELEHNERAQERERAK